MIVVCTVICTRPCTYVLRKNYSQFGVFKNFGIGILFYEVVFARRKRRHWKLNGSVAVPIEELCSEIGAEGTKFEQSLTTRCFY